MEAIIECATGLDVHQGSVAICLDAHGYTVKLRRKPTDCARRATPAHRTRPTYVDVLASHSREKFRPIKLFSPLTITAAQAEFFLIGAAVHGPFHKRYA